ncbi:hypothetical protein F0562_035070 [Nyssa sinensis]|uniref:KIB1-4 beta-propeller domain-containing protein n=1 Tax=Nyssa sinensis TaxID=561372 RepID=A0A5J5AFS5_9ASTE|nr:hypothetical protein F0562_035070 [Nyssa sinensis]
MFCRVGDDKWTKESYDTDQGNGIAAFVDAISFEGNIYGLNGAGNLRLIEVYPHLLQIGSMKASVPNWSEWKKQQLVESHGDLFLVQRTLVGKSMFSLQVFLMDFSERRWIEVVNLGDLVFCLSDNYSFGLLGRELGIRGNSVYFKEDDDDDDLYVFRLDQQSLYSMNQETASVCILSNGFTSVLLRVTDDSRKNEEIISSEEEEDFKGTKEVKIAKSIPTGRDYIQNPLLMFSDGDQKDVYKFYDPIYDVTYYMNDNDLSECQIRFSKDGWLLVSEDLWSIFFYEPFTMTRIQLPDLLLDYRFDGISFSAAPTSSNWVIFGLCCIFSDFITAFYIRSGDEDWTFVTLFPNEKEFISSCGNPVFYGDSFYCLGQDGSLGIFKLTETDYSWCICRELSSPRFFSNTYRAFLVPSKEELFSVFMSHMGNSIQVFKWDAFEMNWEKLDSNILKKQKLFISQTSTLVITTVEEEIMNNTLFFPIFNNTGDNVFYSFESGKYRTLGVDFSDDLYDTKEFLSATWILPLFMM